METSDYCKQVFLGFNTDGTEYWIEVEESSFDDDEE